MSNERSLDVLNQEQVSEVDDTELEETYYKLWEDDRL